MRRKLENHQFVGHGKHDGVERHVLRITIEKEDVWLAVDLVVVAQPRVNLLDEYQEHGP